MIETVTLTGIDENSNPEALVDVGHRFPFVELAVLAGTRDSEPRMPPRRKLPRQPRRRRRRRSPRTTTGTRRRA